MTNQNTESNSKEVKTNMSIPLEFRPLETHSPNVITRIIFLPKPTTIQDVFPFVIIFFVYSLVVFNLFVIWRRLHKKSFNIFLFIMIAIFPIVFSYFFNDYIFLILWLIFIISMSYFAKLVIKRSLEKNIHKKIYNIFKQIFNITNILIFTSQFLTIFSFIFLISKFKIALFFFIYSLYFAVLSREIVSNFSQIMATNTGFYSKEGLPGKSETNIICMLCTEELIDRSDDVVLSCGHKYHKKCIKGWCIIGQNSFCPYCKKGIELGQFKEDLWSRTELYVRPLLNTLRSFIGFFLVISCFLFYKLR